MPTTKSKLEAARIYAQGFPEIPCMFNPYEYRVTKTNSFKENPKKGTNTPLVELTTAGPQTLTLDLFFDTYETGTDVSLITEKLWTLMELNTKVKSGSSTKMQPPEVTFEWGVFKFEAYITSMTQTFTLFTKDGVPVRAKVNIVFTQYIDKKDYKRQNPTSTGSDIEHVWQVVAGDRLDAIAYEVYGEASRWRVIAERNKIRDPLALRPGQTLLIPALGE